VTKSKEHLLEQYEAHGDPETFAARLAQSPGEVREHRFLAKAYLAAHDYAQAGRVTDRGLALHPDDRMLLEVRGEVRAATGDPEGALADWRRAVDAVENMGPIYLSAFLLERLGRLEEAAAAWQSILDWCQEHDAPLTAEWPERERARLRARLAGG
jgi:tetratricopeptide (TPR) repeat protein